MDDRTGVSPDPATTPRAHRPAAASRRHSALVRALRLAVLRSNHWPLSRIYEALYRGMATAVIALLRRRFPAHIEAAFLRGSLAMDVLVPALSDIDLFLVLNDGVSPEEHERLNVFYRRLAALAPVLDPHPWILRWCEVIKLQRENPSLRFRLMEGRHAFERLYGSDRLAELPEPSTAEAAVAQLFDLKTRVTYFNAFCLTRGFSDELEARRKEYMLFKLTVELARITLFLTEDIAVFRRSEIIRRILADRDLCADEILRRLVAHTARFRLRRSFCEAEAIAADSVEERVLKWCLRLLSQFYARDDIRTCPEVTVEHSHFYDDMLFLPTRRPLRLVSEAALADYAGLKRQVIEANAAGADLVLEYDGLLINLGNADAGLGHCTVVAVVPTSAARLMR